MNELESAERIKTSAGITCKGKGKYNGMYGTPTWRTWAGMIKRCTDPRHIVYQYYGGRGITVCENWTVSFQCFLADMGVRPLGMTLDRINGELGYSPENCRWATMREQNRHRRSTVLTSAIVETIRGLHTSGIKGATIARTMNIKRHTVYDVIAGRSWL